MNTTPDVFIIESLRFDDEKRQHCEGSFISHILRLADRRVQYYYIRTRTELEAVLDRFEDSAFRYLHISCHADRKGIELTLDDLDVDKLGALLSPYLENKRVFFSACNLVTPKLARALLKKTGCFSVIGPANAIKFDEAALFWASLYHRMFRNDSMVMKREELQRSLRALTAVFDVNVRYFSASKSAKDGFKQVSVGR